MQWLFDCINAGSCLDETPYFWPLTDSMKQILGKPIISSRELERLSPALRRRHVAELKSVSDDEPKTKSSLPQYDVYYLSIDGSLQKKEIPTRLTPPVIPPTPAVESEPTEETEMECEEDAAEILQSLIDVCNRTIKIYESAMVVEASPNTQLQQLEPATPIHQNTQQQPSSPKSIAESQEQSLSSISITTETTQPTLTLTPTPTPLAVNTSLK